MQDFFAVGRTSYASVNKRRMFCVFFTFTLLYLLIIFNVTVSRVIRILVRIALYVSWCPILVMSTLRKVSFLSYKNTLRVSVENLP